MDEYLKKRRVRYGIKNLRRGLSWWFVGILPFLIIYLVVKFIFFAGYFEILGDREIQLMAHDFFVKILITICIFVSFVAFKRYFLVLIEDVFRSLIDKYFRNEKKRI